MSTEYLSEPALLALLPPAPEQPEGDGWAIARYASAALGLVVVYGGRDADGRARYVVARPPDRRSGSPAAR